MSLRISVVICTWNRAALLDQALARLRELHVPPGVDWELLVVNNRCTDDTEAVLKRHASALPLRCLHEEQSGKSIAANRAVREARGELILWTDDDVLVGHDWLAAYAQAAARWPRATVFGGPVEAWFQAPPPIWVQEAWPVLKDVFALSSEDIPPAEHLLSAGTHPIGANMALRAALQRDFAYNVRMGPRPNSQVRNEDAELMERLRRAGAPMVWVPAARVSHFVPSERMTMAYVRDWKRGEGMSEVLWKGLPRGMCLAGAPRWLWRRFLAERMRAAWLRLQGRSVAWLRAYMQSQFTFGMIQQCRLDNGLNRSR